MAIDLSRLQAFDGFHAGRILGFAPDARIFLRDLENRPLGIKLPADFLRQCVRMPAIGDWLTLTLVDNDIVFGVLTTAVMSRVLAETPATFGFIRALEQLELGRRVARSGWNDKGMWLVYIADSWWSLDAAPLPVDLCTLERQPFIAMKTADNKLAPWLASQTDVLAKDWVVVVE